MSHVGHYLAKIEAAAALHFGGCPRHCRRDEASALFRIDAFCMVVAASNDSLGLPLPGAVRSKIFAIRSA